MESAEAIVDTHDLEGLHLPPGLSQDFIVVQFGEGVAVPQQGRDIPQLQGQRVSHLQPPQGGELPVYCANPVPGGSVRPVRPAAGGEIKPFVLVRRQRQGAYVLHRRDVEGPLFLPLEIKPLLPLCQGRVGPVRHARGHGVKVGVLGEGQQPEAHLPQPPRVRVGS